MKTILILSIILLLSLESLFANIFVNPTTGNDSNNGTINYPIKTLNKAGQIANGGDTIFIRGGNHQHINQDFYRVNSQTGWIYIMPYQNEIVILDGSNDSFPFWDAVLTIESSRNIYIKGLTVRNNNLNSTSGSGIRVNSSIIMSQNIIIDSCIVSNTARQGILIQASNTIVRNCEISNAVMRNQNQNGCEWDGALQAFVDVAQPMYMCNNIEFSNNKIHNCWGEGILLVRTDTFKVKSNTVYDCYSCYIYADNSYNGEISNNWVYSTSNVYNRSCGYPNGYTSPGNGIYFATEKNNYGLDRMVENITIFNNLIVNTGPAFGWFNDSNNTFPNESYRNINIYYNTVYGTVGYQSFYIDPSVNPNRIPPYGCNFKNNIICKARYIGIANNYFTTSNDYYSAWTFTNNCFIDNDIPTGLPSSNIQGNPAFVNPGNPSSPYNFKITQNSICNNSGVVINNINKDYWNATRDNSPCIGFHEYGGIIGIINHHSSEPKINYLSQNYPNPFNPKTKINFSLAKTGFVSLIVYDINGRIIQILINEMKQPGYYTFEFDGSSLSSGIYFYVIESENIKNVKQMVLLK